MGDEQAVFEHIAETLADLFEVDQAVITMDSHLGEDLDIDSIDAIDLMVELKPYIGRKISPEDFKAVRTVGDIVVAVQKLMNDGDGEG